MEAVGYLTASRQLEVASGLDAWTALMHVLVEQLQRVDLPAPLQPALTRAARHWSGDALNLLEVKTEVWRYVDALGPPGTDLSTPEGRMARALLCVLEPTGDEEARSMHAEWFATMTTAAPPAASSGSG